MLGGAKTFGDKEDILEAITYKGHKIGIKSYGDPGIDHKKALSKLIVEFNADIIITASRSYGDTYWTVKGVAEIYGFETIMMFPMSTEEEYAVYPVDKLYTKNAEAILEIINNII